MNPITIGSTPTNDLVEVLNLWIDNQPNSEDYLHWCADTTGFNHGLPIFANYDLTSIEDQCENVNIVVFPNPTTDIVHISGIDAVDVKVYNVLGQLMKTVRSMNAIGVSGLPQGVYLLRITDAEGKKYVVREVVRE